MKKLCLLLLGFFFHTSLIADYSYDENGNIASVFIPGNGEVQYEYDPVQRLTEARYPNGNYFLYTYDYNSNLRSIQGPEGVTTYTYDKLNRIEEAQLPDGNRVAYRYDLMGRITHLTYPDDEVVEYQYDDRGCLIKVKEEGEDTTYVYDDLTNLVVKETLPNGTTTDYVYDTIPQILEVFHSDSQQNLISHFSYEYNKTGQITLCKEETPSSIKTTRYTYDNLDRLISAEDDLENYEKYTYDGAGNRLTKSTQDEIIHYRYDNKNRLIQAGNTTYEYDCVGNLIAKNSPEKKIKYSYDPTGNLITYSDGKNHVQFVYDGKGWRVSKTVNSKTTFFINDPQSPVSRVLIEKDNDGHLKRKYIYGHSRIMQKREGETHYFLYDQPGKSVSYLINHKGCNRLPIHYDSFGNQLSKTSETSYLYNGEEFDEETGLIFLRNRYYDPEMGRFISPDSVLGDLRDPQSLNPYVFVRNNPLSLIDPLGLYGVKVPLTFYGNYPGAKTFTGKSSLGHGWIGGVDANGIHFSQGAYPGGRIEKEESIVSLCPQTVHMTVWVSPEKALAARLASGEAKWGPWNNCIDHVAKALDAIDYPHPSFNMPGGASLPEVYCDWIVQERNHIRPDFLPQQGDLLVDYSMPTPTNQMVEASGKFSYSYFTPNYGGVLLDKSAEFFTELSDIAGVLYDEQMGQMILYGRKRLALPQMEMDDLAVAVRSIYGLGRKGPESPGVSMEPGKGGDNNKGCMVVSYFGDTENTRFGWSMFEADRVLKILSMGIDNITGKKVESSVPGYHNLFEIRARNGWPSPKTQCRLWFVPKKITLSESPDGTSMVFNEALMEVLTESTIRKKGVVEDRAAEKFAQHFTQYYDYFAREHPILSDLKRLGKITAIVKWIHEKNLPFDGSFFQRYIPKYFETPKYSPIIADMLGGYFIKGGVVYTLNEGNYLVQKGEQAERIKEEILRERPNDESLVWNFGRGLTAVAKQIEKSLKVGEVHKTFVDLSYPGFGKIPLAFVRTYSSFNDERGPFGRGWDHSLAKIRFSHPLTPLSFSDGTRLDLYPQVIVRIEGVESIYALTGLNEQKLPVYTKKGEESYLVQDAHGDFLWVRQRERLHFDSQGRLIHIEDANGKGLLYRYEEGYLVEISDLSGKSISFEYGNDQIISASGPGGKIVFYEYYPKGLLQAVKDYEGVLTSYDYDEGDRLIAIYNGRGNKIFEALYDQHHRATEQMIGENFVSQAFNLHDRYAIFEGENDYFYEEYFDPQYRPELIRDAFGREIQFSYGDEEGPQKMVTSNGLEVEYEYDNSGKLSRIYDVYQGERCFAYNPQGQVTKEIDGQGIESVYQYDDLGRLIARYCPFFLSSIGIVDGQSFMKGNTKYLTSFDYDETTGHLKSITFPDGQKRMYKYNNQGFAVQITLEDGIKIFKEYDERCRPKRIVSKGKAVDYEYDDRDRIIGITSQDQSTRFSYDVNGNLISCMDPLNRETHYNYDSFEKLVKTIDPLQGTTTYEYDQSGLHKMILPNGSSRELYYDEYGRPVAMR